LSYKDAYKVAEKLIDIQKNHYGEKPIDKIKQRDEELIINDFTNTISYKHLDGSECCFKYARLEDNTDKKGWLTIYTEHNGYHTLAYDDLEWIKIDNKIVWKMKESY